MSILSFEKDSVHETLWSLRTSKKGGKIEIFSWHRRDRDHAQESLKEVSSSHLRIYCRKNPHGLVFDFQSHCLYFSSQWASLLSLGWQIGRKGQDCSKRAVLLLCLLVEIPAALSTFACLGQVMVTLVHRDLLNLQLLWVGSRSDHTMQHG